MNQGQKGKFPFWLAPTQIRLVPVSDEFIGDCEEIARQLPARVDIDDRDEKVGRRIRDAEKDWVDMIIVYGGKEKESQRLPVRLRTGEIKDYTKDELEKEIKELLKGYPFEGLTIPMHLSKRPIFRG